MVTATVNLNGAEPKRRGRPVKRIDPAEPAKEQPTEIVIPKLVIETFKVKLVGDSPLIMHKFSTKAQQQILDKQMKVATGPKEAKDPDAAYRDAQHRDEDGDLAFPSVGFKAAAVIACSQNLDVTKVQARGAFHVLGEYVKIMGKPRMRQDMVRIHMGTADVRFRCEIPDWSCVLTIRHNPNVLSSAQIINMLNIAGFSVGIGDWRPAKNGNYGMFHVEPA